MGWLDKILDDIEDVQTVYNKNRDQGNSIFGSVINTGQQGLSNKFGTKSPISSLNYPLSGMNVGITKDAIPSDSQLVFPSSFDENTIPWQKRRNNPNFEAMVKYDNGEVGMGGVGDTLSMLQKFKPVEDEDANLGELRHWSNLIMQDKDNNLSYRSHNNTMEDMQGILKSVTENGSNAYTLDAGANSEYYLGNKKHLAQFAETTKKFNDEVRGAFITDSNFRLGKLDHSESIKALDHPAMDMSVDRIIKKYNLKTNPRGCPIQDGSIPSEIAYENGLGNLGTQVNIRALQRLVLN